MNGLAQWMTGQALALALILPTSRAVLGQVVVSGVVTDAAGSEVAHASIEALPRAGAEPVGTVGDRPNPWIQANAHGRFTISLFPGRYKIRAKDESDGYPDPVFMLNSDPAARLPEISVQREAFPMCVWC